jgi:VWFA-related protein
MTNNILSAIVNGAIAGALLAGALWIVLRLIPRNVLGASARYAAWWVAFAALAILPFAFLPHYFGMTPASRPSAAASIPPTNLRTYATPISGTVKPNSTPPGPGFQLPIVVPIGDRARWILLAWACLSVFLLLRLIATCALLARRKREASPVREALIARIAGPLGLPRHIRVLRSSKVSTPVLAGLWRPAILIPERLLSQLSEDELAQITMHEAAHRARRDDYALLLQRVIEALLPLHPAIVLAARQIDFERELACDDHVAASTGEPRRYAACLLRVAELCGSPDSWATAGVTGRRSQLTARVEQLLDRNRTPDSHPHKIRAIVAAAAVAALAYVLAQGPRAVAMPLLSDITEAIQIAPPAPAAVPAMAARATAPLASSEDQAPARPSQKQVALHQQPAEQKAPAAKAAFEAVIVTDFENIPVAGLRKENFRVFADGVEQEIDEFWAETQPLDVEFVIDRSGSMATKQTLIDAAVTQFMRAANPADSFITFTFNDRVEMGTPTSSPAEILAQLRSRPARGGTAMRDAINAVANWTGQRFGQRMIVVISDGVDNASKLRGDELRDVVLASHAQLWAWTLPAPENAPRSQFRWLREAAEASGGHEFVGEDPAPLARAAIPIRYLIRYKLSNQATEDKYRPVRVELVGVSSGTFSIRATPFTPTVITCDKLQPPARCW